MNDQIEPKLIGKTRKLEKKEETRNYLGEYQGLNQNYHFTGIIENMLRRMTKDKSKLISDYRYHVQGACVRMG